MKRRALFSKIAAVAAGVAVGSAVAVETSAASEPGTDDRARLMLDGFYCSDQGRELLMQRALEHTGNAGSLTSPRRADGSDAFLPRRYPVEAYFDCNGEPHWSGPVSRQTCAICTPGSRPVWPGVELDSLCRACRTVALEDA